MDKANELEQPSTSNQPTEAVFLNARQRNVAAAAENLVTRLKQLHGAINDKFLVMVYFDEAHTLQEPQKIYPEIIRNSYFSLLCALNALCEVPIFFVFLSTNPALHTFAPQKSLVSSLRVVGGLELVHPYYELPFDAFAIGATTEARTNKTLTLPQACKLTHMTKFGRPL
ncbi:MAG TPA: hypothetical protein VGO47_08345 [Chlamydiales bacterium]|nr:hypothetical protein [Chlamydiales bacterium]